MNIAIVGAGFSGLATAWHLLDKNPEINIVIFDKTDIGGGASGIAAGLMHPFAGLRAKLNPFAYEGLQASLQLFEIASLALQEPVYQHTQVLRLAYSEDVIDDYRKTAAVHNTVDWISKQSCQSLLPDAIVTEGILIPQGWTVDCKRYLQGLWIACNRLGASFEMSNITSLSSLNHFDRVLICTGAYDRALEEIKALPISRLRGQVVELAWPAHMPHPPYPLNAQGYLLKKPTSQNYILGATFERDNDSDLPNLEIAQQLLRPKLNQIFPQLSQVPFINCKAGLRATTTSKLPLIASIGPKHLYFGGLGSKGLLYHALYAQKAASMLR